MFYIGMKQIADQGGFPNVFELDAATMVCG